MSKPGRTLWWLAGAIVGACLAIVTLQKIRGRINRETIQKRFWNPVYDHLAWLYDGVDWFTGNTTQRLRQPVLRFLPAPGSRVLEIGFGSGRLHLELAGRYQMAGLDQAAGMVRLTRNRLQARGLGSDLRQGSVYHIPWADASFDAVVLTFAFSAFPDASRALAEMIRVVKPGGRIIIVDAGESHTGNRMAHWLSELWEFLGDYMRDEVPLMQAQGLDVHREEYGPWGCIHVVVGTRPEPVR